MFSNAKVNAKKKIVKKEQNESKKPESLSQMQKEGTDKVYRIDKVQPV